MNKKYKPSYLILYKKFSESLRLELGLQNKMLVPKLDKIVLNIGVGNAIQNIKLLDAAKDDLTCISGQKVVVARAHKSIAGFKLRKSMPIGCFVTIRKYRMYEFLERLINTAIPRIKDFRGFSTKSFDGYGNYTLGVKEQIIFPEIDYDKIDSIRGLSITIVTTAHANKSAELLLRKFNFPFKNN